jgi:4a-hydroxytetrahydrobiopterin dehydratase
MRDESATLLAQTPGWRIAADGLSLSREFTFKNFVEAMNFANKITPIAESEGHHPDLAVSWGKVTVTLMTHAIGGLSENDFILAAKIDSIQ